MPSATASCVAGARAHVDVFRRRADQSYQRVGGGYRLDFGNGMEFFGSYVEVTPPSLIVWTNEEGGESTSVTTATMTEEDGRTLLTVSEVYPSKEALDAAGTGDNAIGVYDRGGDGSLSFNSVVRSGDAGVLGLAAVNDVLLSADGDHVYATSPSESSISTFSRNRGSGRLGFVEIEQNGVFGVTGLSGARAMAASADGAHVYVLGGFSNAVAVFGRETSSASPNYGRLTYRGVVQNGVGGVDFNADGTIVYVIAPNNGIHAFRVVPEPGTWALLGAGSLLLAWSVRRRA